MNIELKIIMRLPLHVEPLTNRPRKHKVEHSDGANDSAQNEMSKNATIKKMLLRSLIFF
jgi:hypothetical protein